MTAADFLAGIFADQADDAPRLVLADWLEEYGGQPERAEFIRVQVELAHTSMNLVLPAEAPERWSDPRKVAEIYPINPRYESLSRRERELLTAQTFWDWFGSCMGYAWPGTPAASINGSRVEVGYYQPGERSRWVLRLHRGFFDEIRLPCQAFMSHAAALFGAQPITRVVLVDVDAQLNVYPPDKTRRWSVTIHGDGAGDELHVMHCRDRAALLAELPVFVERIAATYGWW